MACKDRQGDGQLKWEDSTVTHADGSDDEDNRDTLLAQPVIKEISASSGDEHHEHHTSTGSRSHLRTLMYLAALRGDWQAAEIVLQGDPNLFHERITERGDRALHVAAATKRTNFVRELVRKMNPEDLFLENDFGYTAFIYAAASGIVEIAAVMREKNQSLVTCRETRGRDKRTPIYRAALFGNADMVSYLYQFTPLEDLSTDEWFDLLLATIEKKIYDVALKILRNNKLLATKKKGNKTALHLLAEHDMSDISTCREAFLKSLVSVFPPTPCLSGVKSICELPLMRKRAWLLAHELWKEIQGVEEPDLFNQLFSESPILHDAAKVGNVELITMLTRSNPNLIFERDKNGHTIFHVAVMHRQENVFSLIHQMGALKDWIAISQNNKERNNILHLAGELAPPNRLKIVAGAALQMQRELMWYKEVKEIVPSFCLTKKNKKRQLPTELFSPKHEQLLKDGENWLKETANSCMLTATLTATVVYAAAFTVPGGTDGNTGTPILLGRGWFKVFMVSDTAAMFFSTFSIIMFLAILTSRFQEDDFLVSLPRKLILGLTTLFAAILSTIFAFTAACFLLFTAETAWIPATSVAAVACFLITILFIRVHLKLWVDTFQTTCLSKSLFHQSKHSLY